MFSNLNSIIRRGQVFHVWWPCLNIKQHMIFPFPLFSQQNPWLCIPVNRFFFISMEINHQSWKKHLELLYQHLEDVYYRVQWKKVDHCTIDECHMVQFYKWYCRAFYQIVSTMQWMKQLLLFLAILVTGHLNITWYANVNGHLAMVLSHHWKLQYNDMHVDCIESNHDSDVFPMRFASNDCFK
jgi:hypothetical protein